MNYWWEVYSIKILKKISNKQKTPYHQEIEWTVEDVIKRLDEIFDNSFHYYTTKFPCSIVPIFIHKWSQIHSHITFWKAKYHSNTGELYLSITWTQESVDESVELLKDEFFTKHVQECFLNNDNN